MALIKKCGNNKVRKMSDISTQIAILSLREKLK
jgi:hypothetical protein